MKTPSAGWWQGQPIRLFFPALAGLLLFAATLHAQASTSPESELSGVSAPSSGTVPGWWFPGTVRFSGNFEASVDGHVWTDHFSIRNLQFRMQMNLFEGLRLNSVLRSNHDMNGLETLDPFFDELYLEFYGYYTGRHSTSSFSLRGGRIRYLRFPFPDILSIFNIVPGISDLNPINATTTTAFDGAVINLDWALHSGLGAHLLFWQQPAATIDLRRGLLESYAFYRTSYRFMELEARTGFLQPRPDPRGNSALGASIYLGSRWPGFRIGGMLEVLADSRVYAGVLVQFTPNVVTNVLGTFHADYTRAPEGFGFTLPIIKGSFGYVQASDVEGEPVGEILAERRMTFWQNSQARNFYEHQISFRGQISGDNLAVVCDEYPWYLKNESPVGLLRELDDVSDILAWNNSAARLGEVAQPVVYRFYKTTGAKPKPRLVIRPGMESILRY